MDKVKLTKTIIAGTAGLGIGKIVGGIAYSHTVRRNMLESLAVFTGALVVTSIVVNASTKHIDEQVDRFIVWFTGDEKNIA